LKKLNFKDRTVLITGGASGIGKIMGRLVIEKGARLIIWDIDQKNLDQTLAEFSVMGSVSGNCIDITNLDLVKETASRVKEEFGFIDVLINNAGIVVGKYFHEHSRDDIERTMNINSNAPMHLSLEFLGEMIHRDSGHICNIASSAGLVSNPKMAVYVASKWAMIGWSDSLRLEMQQLNKNIGITTVTPYYINTGMFDGVKSKIPLLDPERSSAKIIKAIENRRIYLSMPWSMQFVRFFQGLLPIWFFDWFVGKVMGVYTTMEDYKGRIKEKNGN